MIYMARKLKRYLILIGLNIPIFLSGQNVLDGIYVPCHRQGIKCHTYTSLRHSDIMWEKRIWRNIDTSEKINQVLFNSSQHYKSLWQIVLNAVKQNPDSISFYECDSLKGYNFFGHSIKFIADSSNLCVDNLTCLNLCSYNSNDITAWEVMEDWYFDKERSVMDVKIVAISPCIRNKEISTGKLKGTKNLCWIWFEDLIPVLENAEIYRPCCDAQRLTFYDLFYRRMFKSYILKESNVYDRLLTPPINVN